MSPYSSILFYENILAKMDYCSRCCLFLILCSISLRSRASDSCPPIKNISVNTEISFQGDGFHRILFTDVNLISTERLVECKVIFQFRIPSGAFLDLETLQITSIGRGGPFTLNWYTPHEFDIEKNIHEDKNVEKSFYVCTDRTIINTFVMNETFWFPVHFYYGRPTLESEFKIIDFPHPDVLMRCKKRRKDEVCGKIVKAPCSCIGKTQKELGLCSWSLLENISAHSKRIQAKIPIGILGHTILVISSTLMAVLCGCAYLIHGICKSEGVNWKDKKE